MSGSILVSIIAPCYNGELSVPLFLDSVAEQDYPNIELILIDDGSIDNTKNIIESYRKRLEDCNRSLIYLYQENAGQAAAINVGLKVFHGDYIMWVDSDDILMPNNVSKKVSYLEKHSDCGFVLSQEAAVNYTDLNTVKKITARKHDRKSDLIFTDMIDGKNVVFGPGTILVRRSAMMKSFPDMEIFPSREGQNWQLMLPLCYMHKCGYIDEPLLKCVSYPESHSHMKRSDDELYRRYDGIAELIIRTIDGIVCMSKKEKNRWIRYVTNKYLRVNLYLAYQNRNIKRASLYKRKLIDNHGYHFWCHRCVQTLLRKIRY